MPLITARKTQPTYDVIVVGSGAGGGQAAYTLAMAGAKVLMLEAGRNYDPGRETPMFQSLGQAPLRGVPTPDKPMGFYDATVDGGWEVPGEPFTTTTAERENTFTWWRARMLGGRTNHWARHSLRNGPYDFKPRSRDGLGFDWPISYDELAPYYDKVEMLIGVHGDNHGLENIPDSSPGVLLPPPKPRAGELLAQHRAKRLGIPVIPLHRAVLTRALDAETIPSKLHPGNPAAQQILAREMRLRSPCFYATPCDRGCSIRATYQSGTVHLPPALATGNLDIVTDAMVAEVTIGADGRATGIAYIDKPTGDRRTVRARVVMLAASSAESVRILFNSRSAQFPNGVATSSGLLGKYIMDSVGCGIGGQIPLLENLPPHNEDGAGGNHVYIPWWLYREQLAGKLDFPRGYHIEFGTGRGMPGMGTGGGRDGQYGRRFKEDVRRYYGSHIYFGGRGEMIPNEHSFFELDPVVKDRWGLPVLRFHWRWTDYELNQVRHMRRQAAELIAAMGGTPNDSPDRDPRAVIRPGGNVKHEVGGAIMGEDPKKSVTTPWCRTWEVPNIYFADGAPFCSSADKNPTVTIMALAWRTADHVLAEMGRGNL